MQLTDSLRKSRICMQTPNINIKACRRPHFPSSKRRRTRERIGPSSRAVWDAHAPVHTAHMRSTTPRRKWRHRGFWLHGRVPARRKHGVYKYGDLVWNGHVTVFWAERTCSCGEGTCDIFGDERILDPMSRVNSAEASPRARGQGPGAEKRWGTGGTVPLGPH